MSHESHRALQEEWLTPPWLLQRLGDFDLDPCAPSDARRPWEIAKKHYSIEDNGLNHEWRGRVWLNPPYGSKLAHWMKRLHSHADGLALIPARTDTKVFFDYVWNEADAILFFRGRLRFHHANGQKSSNSMGAAHVLVAYGKNNARALGNLTDLGYFVSLNEYGAVAWDARGAAAHGVQGDRKVGSQSHRALPIPADKTSVGQP
jgi:hypothetical protein